MITVSHLSVAPRLLPLSFQCECGEIAHIVGPNGSGKSTLLAAMSGMLSAREGCRGRVLIGGKNLLGQSVALQASQRAYLAQHGQALFNLSVVQYLALSLPAQVSLQQKAAQLAIGEISELVNIADMLARGLNTLSGGEYQRVRLAGVCLQCWRALNPKAQFIALDEPAAALDIAQQGLLYKLMATLAKQGLAVIIANHDLNRTLRHADKVLLLNQGVLEGCGPPADVLSCERLARVFHTHVKQVSLDNRPYLIFD